MLVAAATLMPLEASACSAVTAVRNGVGVVDIVCSPGDAPVAPFRASGGPAEGGGIDTLTMSGGSIVANGLATPTVNGVSNLAPSVGVIDMLGGNDIVNISGGTIGTAASPIGIVLGAGADTFNMSGGTISGSVFGLGGGNTYAVSGGTIVGSLFAGSQNDRVTISGTANILGDTRIGPDSVGLEDGNDTFVMTGGTLRGAVSGGNGNDVLTISGGTIGGYVAGNAGVDRINISGGTIAWRCRSRNGDAHRRHHRRQYCRHRQHNAGDQRCRLGCADQSAQRRADQRHRRGRGRSPIRISRQAEPRHKCSTASPR